MPTQSSLEVTSRRSEEFQRSATRKTKHFSPGWRQRHQPPGIGSGRPDRPPDSGGCRLHFPAIGLGGGAMETWSCACKHHEGNSENFGK